MRFIAERVYMKIFDKKENQFTEKGLEIMRAANINPDNVISKNFEEFRQSFEHEEIARVHFQHYKMKRIKYLNKLSRFLEDYDKNEDSKVAHMYYFNNSRNQYQILSQFPEGSLIKSRGNKGQLSIKANSIISKTFDKNAQSMPYQEAALKHKATNHSQELHGAANSGGLFQTEVYIKDTDNQGNKTKKKKLVKEITFHKQLQSQREQQSLQLSQKQIKDQTSTDTLTRYMKARDLAEQKAKEKIDKLNTMIDKWEKRDQKAKELIMESIMEKRLKAEHESQKIEQARLKYQKRLKEMEDRSSKQYLQELQQRRESQNSLLKQSTDFERSRHNKTVLDSVHQKDSLTPNKRKMSETSLKLESLERKIGMAQERSVLQKREIAQKCESEVNKSPEVNKAIEESKLNKFSKYLEKMRKHGKLMTEKLEYQRHNMQAARERFEMKYSTCSQTKLEQERERQRKRDQFFKNEKEKEDSVDQTRHQAYIIMLKKSEQSKLRMLDLKEQYEEVNEQQRLKRDKIIEKHRNIEKNVQAIKENDKVVHDMRIRQNEEKRKFLELHSFLSPYEEAKLKFLKHEGRAKTRKGKGQATLSKSFENQATQQYL